MKKTVILDADNTLWKLQCLYDEVRENFLDMLGTLGIDRESARLKMQEMSADFIHKINPETGQQYLYSAARLPASFAATLQHFDSNISAEHLLQAKAIADGVFDKVAEPMEGASDMVAALKAAGYQLIVLTKGEEWVQKKRLNDFASIGMIDHMVIVPEKTIETFQNIIRNYDLDPTRSFSLGDSTGSDIVPADAAGLHTILLMSHTWSLEREQRAPAKTKIISALKEVINIISGVEQKMEKDQKLDVLKSRLRQAWSVATTSDPQNWTPENPAWGQCAVTACVVQDEIGGDILWALALLPDGRKISHYFNSEGDLTNQQFPEGTIIPSGQPRTQGFATTRDYVLSVEKTRERYHNLKTALSRP